MKKTLYLMRHGETLFNQQKKSRVGATLPSHQTDSNKP